MKIISEAVKRRLAVEASVDPRTIMKLLAGEPVREGLARERALAALLAAGYTVPLAPEGKHP